MSWGLPSALSKLGNERMERRAAAEAMRQTCKLPPFAPASGSCLTPRPTENHGVGGSICYRQAAGQARGLPLPPPVHGQFMDNRRIGADTKT